MDIGMRLIMLKWAVSLAALSALLSWGLSHLDWSIVPLLSVLSVLTLITALLTIFALLATLGSDWYEKARNASTIYGSPDKSGDKW
jgi:Na+/glutamate symporter